MARSDRYDRYELDWSKQEEKNLLDNPVAKIPKKKFDLQAWEAKDKAANPKDYWDDVIRAFGARTGGVSPIWLGGKSQKRQERQKQAEKDWANAQPTIDLDKKLATPRTVTPDKTPWEKQLRAEYGTLDAQYDRALQLNEQGFAEKEQMLQDAEERAKFRALFVAGRGGVGAASQRIQDLSLKSFATKQDFLNHLNKRREEFKFQKELKRKELAAKIASQPGALGNLLGQEQSDVAGSDKSVIALSTVQIDELTKNFSNEEIGNMVYQNFKVKLDQKQQAAFENEYGDVETKSQIADIISKQSSNTLIQLNKKDLSVSTYSPSTQELNIYNKDPDSGLEKNDDASISRQLVSNLKNLANKEFLNVKDIVAEPGTPQYKILQNPKLAGQLIALSIQQQRESFLKGKVSIYQMQEYKTALEMIMEDPVRMSNWLHETTLSYLNI